MTDISIRDDVLKELDFDPQVNSARVGVSVEGGVVTLTGHVGSYPEKCEAVLAARRVKGVYAIANEIEVRFPEERQIADDEIARRAADVLRWDSMLPPTVKVTVQHGLVMLSGRVEWYYQRLVAEENVRKLSGVKGIVNNITVGAKADARTIRIQVEEALKRYAEIEAEGIQVNVKNGHHVVLSGNVHNWSELDAAERAAIAARGVQSVENQLVIVPNATWTIMS
jgi:hyperosmotically inducible protein